MDSIDLEVLKTANDWSQRGAYTLLATVVRTWGSAPRPIGSMMVMRGDGHVRGSISGGCIEDDLIRQVQSGEFQAAAAVTADAPRVLTYGISADAAHRFGLPCGGTLQIVLERVTEKSMLPALLSILQQQDLVTRELDMQTGQVNLQRGSISPAVAFDDRKLVTAHGPRYRLVIVGAAQISRYVASLALSLDYAVTVCDPRAEYLAEWDVPGVQLSTEMPDDLLLRLQLDSRSAVVTLTHDPKLDDMALLVALSSPAFYVGAIGSRANDEKRRARLRLFAISDQEIAKLHGPVGLYLGARTPPEIALSVLAEMTAIRNGVAVLQTHALRKRDTPARAPGCIPL